MCLSSPKPAAPVKQTYYTSSGQRVQGDPGLPQSAIDAGIYSTTGYQAQTQQDIANQQITAQKAIADQQNTFNQQQLAAMQAMQTQQQQQITDQANRQTAYDTGRASQLSDATNRINAAFATFSPDYFKQYANDYMGQVSDQLDYQRQQANRTMLYGLARQGLSRSQELANATGLLDETQGRALADQSAQAQGQAAALQTQVAQARQSLLGQVQQAQSVGGPIAASTLGDVNNNLNTQAQQISGITNNANDVVATLKGVPQVSTLGSIFGGVLGGLGSYMGGVNSQNAMNAYRNAARGGFGAGSPSGSSGWTGFS